MARWQPDGPDRLAEAALALYAERGFEQTTVAEIAARAGLTERTFFRHYADKREVLFAGSDDLRDLLVRTVADAPASTPPLDAAAGGIAALGAMFNAERLPFARRRAAIIAASSELQERELIKMATLTEAVAETLRGRGVDEPAASLAAEVAIGVFAVAFTRWIAKGNRRPFEDLVAEAVGEVRALTSAVGPRPL